MLKKKILLLLLYISFLFAARADEGCPSINIGNDLLEIQKNLSLKVYNSPINGSDEETKKTITELRGLAESGNSYQKHISYTVALWFSAYIGHLKESSSFCGLAELINASVSKDPEQLRSALESAAVLEKELSLYRQQNSIEAAGCCADPVAKNVKSEGCYQNGYAYEIDILWKNRGNVLPSDFNNIIHKLYNSKLIVNKFLGLLISYCITSEIQALTEKFPLAVSLQATSLQFSCKIPECCCENRLAILETLSGDTAYASRDILYSLKPPCICPEINITQDNYEVIENNISVQILDGLQNSSSLSCESVIDTLVGMAYSENHKYRGITFLTSAIYGTLNSHLEGAPSLCAFADVINATVTYNYGKNKTNLIDALESVKVLVEYIYYFNQIESISASSCKSEIMVPKPLVQAVSGCYEDGYAYKIKQLWSIQRKRVPPGLGYKVEMLYDSNDEHERLLALVLSFAICPSVLDSWCTYDSAFAYEAFSYTISKPIPKCCCSDRLYAISKISQTSINIWKRVIEDVKHFYCTD